LIDLDGTLFCERARQVKTYGTDQWKTTADVLCGVHHPNDYLVLDRCEWKWDSSDHPNMVIVKTFAPLSGKPKLDGVELQPLTYSFGAILSKLVDQRYLQENGWFKLSD
jgi:hypothetical protein